MNSAPVISERVKLDILRRVGMIQCPCGNVKRKEGIPFCRRCYFLLPKDIRKRLSDARFGKGFEEAYAQAFYLLSDVFAQQQLGIAESES